MQNKKIKTCEIPKKEYSQVFFIELKKGQNSKGGINLEKIRYFDHAATTYVKDEVLRVMLPYFGLNYGNPSSIYSIGRQNKRTIDYAREQVARAIGANPKEIYFTSCGSESDNLAIKGTCYANKYRGNHIITTKIEHHAVLNSCATLERQGFEVTYLGIDKVRKDKFRRIRKCYKKRYDFN